MEGIRENAHNKNHFLKFVLVSTLVLVGIISMVMCVIKKEYIWLSAEIFSIIIAHCILTSEKKTNPKKPSLMRSFIVLVACVCVIAFVNTFIEFVPNSIMIAAVAISFVPTIVLVGKNVISYY
jgi:hypothetical protein